MIPESRDLSDVNFLCPLSYFPIFVQGIYKRFEIREKQFVLLENEKAVSEDRRTLGKRKEEAGESGI